MKFKTPLLIIFTILFIIASIYSIKNNKYSVKDFNDILTIKHEEITEIRVSNLVATERCTKDPDQINLILNYFASFKYKRLMNDETAYMPMRLRIIYIIGADGESEYIVPYGSEAMISYKVYQVKLGKINEKTLTSIYSSLPEQACNI